MLQAKSRATCDCTSLSLQPLRTCARTNDYHMSHNKRKAQHHMHRLESWSGQSVSNGVTPRIIINAENTPVPAERERCNTHWSHCLGSHLAPPLCAKACFYTNAHCTMASPCAILRCALWAAACPTPPRSALMRGQAMCNITGADAWGCSELAKGEPSTQKGASRNTRRHKHAMEAGMCWQRMAKERSRVATTMTEPRKCLTHRPRKRMGATTQG